MRTKPILRTHIFLVFRMVSWNCEMDILPKTNTRSHLIVKYTNKRNSLTFQKKGTSQKKGNVPEKRTRPRKKGTSQKKRNVPGKRKLGMENSVDSLLDQVRESINDYADCHDESPKSLPNVLDSAEFEMWARFKCFQPRKRLFIFSP